MSGNEELQSLNEELETAKEELQSSNEELTTINDEMQSRNQELNQSNNDLVNLDGKASSVGRDPCKLWDASQQRRIGLYVLEKVLGREPEQRRIRLMLGNLYRENGCPVHPPKCFEVPTVVKNGDAFWHTHGFRLRQSRFDHPLCQFR